MKKWRPRNGRRRNKPRVDILKYSAKSGICFRQSQESGGTVEVGRVHALFLGQTYSDGRHMEAAIIDIA
jgi:hypothetical protein